MTILSACNQPSEEWRLQRLRKVFGAALRMIYTMDSEAAVIFCTGLYGLYDQKGKLTVAWASHGAAERFANVINAAWREACEYEVTHDVRAPQ